MDNEYLCEVNTKSLASLFSNKTVEFLIILWLIFSCKNGDIVENCCGSNYWQGMVDQDLYSQAIF